MEIERQKIEQDDRQVLEIAMEAGHILLENGAEIFRVEDTMRRICTHFGVESGNFFVLSNGIFTTGGDGPKGQFAKVKHIPVQAGNLERVVAVNQLSREIGEGRYTLEEVKARLSEIRGIPDKSPLMQMLASAIGSACFTYLLDGSLTDCMVAFIAGFLLYIFVLKVSAPHMSKIIGKISGGALVTLICIVFHYFGFGDDLNHMIIGSILPLIPSVAFTNGIRDIANGDYLSGTVRLLDAILGFLCIAIGVGVMFTIYYRVIGGLL